MSGPTIDQVILFQIEQTSKLAKQHSQREFDRLGLGITVEQWILLKIIHEAQALSQKELSERSRRDPASITRTMDLLEELGLVMRLDDDHDRRLYKLSLSAAGRAFVKKHMAMVRVLRDRSVKGFSKAELGQLSAFLQRIQGNLK
jgi:MarR family transcriptional regulator, transcriptional regulator for hemolysin